MPLKDSRWLSFDEMARHTCAYVSLAPERWFEEPVIGGDENLAQLTCESLRIGSVGEEGVNQIWLDILWWRWWSIVIDSAPCSKVPCDVFYHFPLRLDVPAELSQMKIRDVGALRKKALDVQQKLDVSHFLPCFTMIYQHPGILEMVILWPLVTGWKPGPMPFVGVVPQLLALFCQGVICYHTILIWFNHMYISAGLHIYVVNVRVHPSISIHGCTKKSAFQGRDLSRFAEVMGIGLPLISPERTWLLRLRGHAQFWRCFGMHLWVSCFGMWCIMSMSIKYLYAHEKVPPNIFIQRRKRYLLGWFRANGVFLQNLRNTYSFMKTN